MLTEEQLRSFCGRNTDGRWDFSAPFPSDGHTVATDQRICIFIPRQPEWECPDNPEKRPPIGRLNLLAEFDSGEFVSWRESVGTIPPIEYEACEACAGSGECECMQCDTVHTCGICEGKKQFPLPVRHKVLGHEFDNRMIDKLSALEPTDCRIHVIDIDLTKNAKRKEPAACLLVNGDGWAAAVMAMTEEKRDAKDR